MQLLSIYATRTSVPTEPYDEKNLRSKTTTINTDKFGAYPPTFTLTGKNYAMLDWEIQKWLCNLQTDESTIFRSWHRESDEVPQIGTSASRSGKDNF